MALDIFRRFQRDDVLGLSVELFPLAIRTAAICRIAETRPIWRQVSVALARTLLAGTSVVVSFVIMVVGGLAAQDVAASLGLQAEAAGAIGMPRLPVVILAVGAASGFLYWAAPARQPRSARSSPAYSSSSAPG